MKRNGLVIIFIMTYTTIIQNLAHPVTPQLVYSLGYDAFLYGVLYAAMSLSNFLFSPLWGIKSEKYGRKVFMVLGPIGYSLSQLGFGFSNNPYVIILFRLLSGMFACASTVAGLALLIDRTEIAKRSRVISLYTALTGFGANIGYLIGGSVGDEDYRNAFLLQAIAALLLSVIVLFGIKDEKKTGSIKNKEKFFITIMRYRNTLLPFILILIIATSFVATGFNIGFNSFLKGNLNFSPLKIGFIMAISGIIGIITNVFIFPFIQRRFNDYYILLFSLLFLGVTLFLLTYFEALVVKGVILLFFFAFLALYRPILQSFLSRIGKNNGELMGLSNAGTSYGNFFGSTLTGALFVYNVNLTFYTLSLLCFLVFCALFLKKDRMSNFMEEL